MEKVLSTIENIFISLKGHRRVHVRTVASLVGQVISMSVVNGHIAQIMTRSLSMDVLSARHCDQFIPLSDESVHQLQFWKSNLAAINSRDICVSFKCTKVVYSDASSTGNAGYVGNTLFGISHGIWTAVEAKRSSTWREMVGIYRVLQSLLPF